MKQMDGFILTSRYEGQGIENLKAYNNQIPVLKQLNKDKKRKQQIDELKKYNDDILNKFNDLLK